uniref:Uncharacterized protein n=1 Tax=Candidatus Kentrum sp. SD TaxID=2126332 RepID=A0A450YW34_9GAMM|nr:MAG: hypothetical protein BECKSD772F_GA0070984_12494 [Candidatus Kentron sp. SD]VFK49796.1 MAG: hypothetical protein BECKSD772E_GA0070983_12403 [Candidatus Kentron sp. SD]
MKPINIDFSVLLLEKIDLGYVIDGGFTKKGEKIFNALKDRSLFRIPIPEDIRKEVEQLDLFRDLLELYDKILKERSIAHRSIKYEIIDKWDDLEYKKEYKLYPSQSN